VILADTKFEFGVHPGTGDIALGDEVLTSDSSRYWDGELYTEGGIHRLDSFDKQLVRNWLSAHWSGEGAPPRLPEDLVAHTKARYLELYARLTGQDFQVSQ
jgi:phosphoribosylaminoimidazole-succinocarboxamide synthase